MEKDSDMEELLIDPTERVLNIETDVTCSVMRSGVMMFTTISTLKAGETFKLAGNDDWNLVLQDPVFKPNEGGWKIPHYTL